MLGRKLFSQPSYVQHGESMKVDPKVAQPGYFGIGRILLWEFYDFVADLPFPGRIDEHDVRCYSNAMTVLT